MRFGRRTLSISFCAAQRLWEPWQIKLLPPNVRGTVLRHTIPAWAMCWYFWRQISICMFDSLRFAY